MPRPIRFFLVALGMSLLLGGMFSGLLRLGVSPPQWVWRSLPDGFVAEPLGALISHHGGLMIGGFIGTVISLERAVALGRPWCFLGPLTAAAGGWMIVWIEPAAGGIALITGASVILIVDFMVILHRQRVTFTVVMALGAVAWFVGNLLWLGGWSIPRLMPWWGAFLVLTIVGERLELSRFVPGHPWRRSTFLGATGIYGAGLLLGLQWPGLGLVVSGAGLVSLSVWLGIFDAARRTIRQGGLPRFVAVALLGGFGWLGVGGLLRMSVPFQAAVRQGDSRDWTQIVLAHGPVYDAVWHTVLVGFVMVMIFAHAPIIFPAVLGIRIGFTRWFYVHLAFLHLTLAVRIAGDMFQEPTWRTWGGLGNAAAVMLFLAMTVTSIRRAGPPEKKVADEPRPLSVVQLSQHTHRTFNDRH